MNATLEMLVDRARTGDYSAASQLIAQSYAGIFAYFRRMCGNEEDAADLTQRAFLKVWQSLAGFRGRSSVKTWIHSIAHHVYVDWRRQPRRSEPAPQHWWDTCVSESPSPLESAMERDAARSLYFAVEQLDEDQRETVTLHYYQGLSIQETAETLGVATSTVKYRLRNALEVLQSRMGERKVPA
jgi:RNA polymerase sigma-70 factor (ECF subfamily)